MAKSRRNNGPTAPQFAAFCQELTDFYVNDDIKPALHVSRLPATGQSGPSWYIAIHRYPHGWGHDDALTRTVVCTNKRSSFGVALMMLHRDWLEVRDLESAEETRNWTALRDSR